MPKPLLVTADVARLLRVHPKQVYRLMAKGLPARRVGSEWRFDEADVLGWANAPGEGAPPSPAPSHEVARGAPPLLAANGDVVVEMLLDALVADGHPPIGFVRADRTSALDALAARRVLLSAYHGGPCPTTLQNARIARIHLVVREVGLASAAALPSVAALGGKVLAGRPRTAGIRGHLERALAMAKLSPKRLAMTEQAHPSHAAAVLAVLRRDADVALTTAAWAERAGLSFFPLAREPYDLLLFAEDLGSAPVVATCEVAQSAAFRSALARVAGYDPSRAGEIRYDLEPRPASPNVSTKARPRGESR